MANILLKAVAPGRAELRISPWETDASQIELSVRRNADTPYLDIASRGWVSDEQWISLQGASVQGQTLIMPVGPDFVDTLLAGTQGQSCRGYTRVAGGEATRHSFRCDADVLPSSAAGAAPKIGGSSAISAAAAPKPADPPVMQNDPPIAASGLPDDYLKPKRQRLVPILLTMLLVALLGALAYYFLNQARKPAETVVTPPQATQACSVAALPGADTMSFVQSCIRDVKEADALLAVIHAARDAGQCDIAQRLYANRANAGDITVALAYAQEYDPASAKSACFKPEAATARYWYESVLEKQADQPDALAKLQALPK
ncbi:hypothetical protein [Bordetella avium]|uniref:Membrane protein n=1 Tax=Bordetella avium (strain 197N) TaxID=360910 RepID=Q2KWL5_BORA1|nr:hypothetical protein [Bordetella avium]RIQ13424.1 hypothetical protein D0432_09390 [Bordetella avium]RIQ16620.1 hypothetical protein D0850_14700 [Bordetella avium]RIQ31380.1 hypothetical protein D0849_14800 [Bordetella avium]RIQ36768.1 hypothetical protein D0848_14135 [Bordetella avium]RIQ40767.1 hypothetical protein D0847_12595 [Bordetella avium]